MVMPEEYKYAFANGFRKKRESNTDVNGKKYTQDTFALEFDMNTSTVSKWEEGASIPKTETLIKLCQFFNCTIDSLFGVINDSNHDIQFIDDYTGLNEDAIKTLNALKTGESNKTVCRLINNDHFISFIIDLRLYYAQRDIYVDQLAAFAKETKRWEDLDTTSKSSESKLLSIANGCALEITSPLRDTSIDLLEQNDKVNYCAFRVQQSLFRLINN